MVMSATTVDERNSLESPTPNPPVDCRPTGPPSPSVPSPVPRLRPSPQLRGLQLTSPVFSIASGMRAKVSGPDADGMLR